MKRFSVGIDLGTTNTVVAYMEPGNDAIRLFEMEQLVAPGEVGAAPLLPSLRYHAAPGELPAGALDLPWRRHDDAANPPVVIGALARKLGAQVPGRLVSSAKSWLSHAAVDRLAPILPWGAADDVAKVSPVAASASYLAYARAAWNARFAQFPLEQQEVVLTIPASFDEGARALTVEAARDAGLPNVRLVEEPQAACYDWLFRHRTALATELASTRLILVCDVGGGTTDFSLIKVALNDGEPQITRIGVGKHLMLGGDNMDLVLAHHVESRMSAAGPQQAGAGRLSASRLSQLLERCRAAKERLLAANAPERTAVTLLGAGSKLVGSASSVDLTRTDVERAIVDGFFPLVAPTEQARQRRSGIVEFGLPYASDAAITRHLASFLAQHASAAREALGDLAPDEQALPVPDTLLLNGGVFRAPALADRLADTLAAWRGQPLRILHNENPDVAVARGAVAYSLARSGLSPKIGGGSPRSYFLVIDDTDAARRASGSRHAHQHGPATARVASRGICILPRGSEEGAEILLQDRIFALRLGQPVRFHLVAASADIGDGPARAGDLVDLDTGDFVRLPPIATVLRPAAAGGTREVPVQLATALTEVGTLEMYCVSTEESAQRWLLEFQLRGEHAPPGEGSKDNEAASAALPPRFTDAIERIDRIFGARAQKVDPKEVRQLRSQLEKLIGSREQWPTPLLRQLFDALWQRARGRRRSVDHEKMWLNLAGYCLRPGFGDPLDAWRIEQLWPLFASGTQHRRDRQLASEWWTMWRRVAGGLDSDAQLRLLEDFAFNVQVDEAERGRRPPELVDGSVEDMLRLVASLERIPAAYKAEIGEWLIDRVKMHDGKDHAAADNLVLWTLARVGARQLFYGSAHEVVPPETTAGWLETLLALDWKRIETAPFAAAHLARMTEDRSRDIAPALRERIIQRLALIHAPPGWIAMVRETVQLDEAAQRGFVGESLPPGLKLIE